MGMPGTGYLARTRAKGASMKFDQETTDVTIGGYLSEDAARQDYDAVLACGGYLHGAVVVSKSLKGDLAVEETDHMVREGAAGLGAVGFAVGLFFAPPLLATTAIGAAMGAVSGEVLHRRTTSKLGEQVGRTLPLGGGGLLVAYPHSQAEHIKPAITRAIEKTTGEAEGHHVKALRGALADAQRKMAEQERSS